MRERKKKGERERRREEERKEKGGVGREFFNPIFLLIEMFRLFTFNVISDKF